MSFQDVKRRQHPIFHNHRYASSSDDSSDDPGTSGHNMLVDRRQTTSSPRHAVNTVPQHRQLQSNPPQFPNSKVKKPLPQKQTPSSPRTRSTREKSVRPRLTTTCPVTQKSLMHEEESIPSYDTQSMESFSDEQSLNLPRTRRESPRSQSRFAHLNNAIVNFQKMVSELESLLRIAGASPETQWRSRILIQSAKDADDDIQLQLDKVGQRQIHGPKVAALRKLQRDYSRARQHMAQTLRQHELQQQADVALLRGQNHEDFFDKAMRERDEAVKQLNSSLNQVNAIYQDLADLVDEQQGPIDSLDRTTEDAKTNTRDGLKQVQASVFGLCAGEGQVDDDVQRRLEIERNKAEEGYRVGEDFEWGMPFETLAKDLLSVQADVVKFGQGLWDEVHGTVMEGRLSGCANTVDCSRGGAEEDTNSVSSVQEQEEPASSHRPTRSPSKRRQ